MSGEWRNGLCSCFNDCGLCIITYFCPCYTAGKNAEFVGKSCLLCGFLSLIEPIGCVVRALNRQDLRNQFNIEGSIVGDVLTHVCCPCCGLVQEAQEIKEGGPSAGSMNR